MFIRKDAVHSIDALHLLPCILFSMTEFLCGIKTDMMNVMSVENGTDDEKDITIILRDIDWQV